jgi:TRAP-type C4-dicarboxylate transport system permease small subunit
MVQMLCGGLAATALFAIMLITLVDVTGRKLWNQSLPGSLELTEMLMVAVIFAALPLVSLRNEHVVFDSLDRRLTMTVLRWQLRLTHAACAAMLGGVAWLMWHKARDMVGYGDVTAQLGVPQGPFVYAMSVLIGLTAAIHLKLMLRQPE